jgi:hypothetical protein
MSEHAVMRRRIDALDRALEALRDWGTGESAGPVGHYSNELAINAADHGESGDGLNPGVWCSAHHLYAMIVELRAEVADMAIMVEREAIADTSTWGGA